METVQYLRYRHLPRCRRPFLGRCRQRSVLTLLTYFSPFCPSHYHFMSLDHVHLHLLPLLLLFVHPQLTPLTGPRPADRLQLHSLDTLCLCCYPLCYCNEAKRRLNEQERHLSKLFPRVQPRFSSVTQTESQFYFAPGLFHELRCHFTAA